jgi:hypothetical protein
MTSRKEAKKLGLMLRITKNACAMTFEFGTGPLFSFSSNDGVVIVPGSGHTTEFAPTIVFDPEKGEVKIREQIRIIDPYTRKAVNPARFVEYSVTLTAGDYAFDYPDNSPGPGGISLDFFLPKGKTWPLPVATSMLMPTNLYQPLLKLDQYRSQWSAVNKIRVIFWNGVDCSHFSMGKLMDCCSQAQAAAPVVTPLPPIRAIAAIPPRPSTALPVTTAATTAAPDLLLSYEEPEALSRAMVLEGQVAALTLSDNGGSERLVAALKQVHLCRLRGDFGRAVSLQREAAGVLWGIAPTDLMMVDELSRIRGCQQLRSREKMGAEH